MKKILYVVLMLLIVGCAAREHSVMLDTPNPVKDSNIVVVDGRLDKNLYMTGISYTNQSHIYILSPNPPIEVALKQAIQANEKLLNKSGFIKAEVNIEGIDIKDKVGFAKADELYCTIVSKLKVTKANGQIKEYTVKTFSVNKENMSARVGPTGKLILDQSLQEHGSDLIKKL